MRGATQKRATKKRGRPATGLNPIVGVRLPEELIARVDAKAAKAGVTRSKMIRQMIEKGAG